MSYKMDHVTNDMDDVLPPPPNIPPPSPIILPESPFCQPESPVSHFPKRVSSPANSVSSYALPGLVHGNSRRLDLDDSLLSYETSNQHMPDYQRFHMVNFLIFIYMNLLLTFPTF